MMILYLVINLEAKKIIFHLYHLILIVSFPWYYLYSVEKDLD
jgi:hypothetical protein